MAAEGVVAWGVEGAPLLLQTSAVLWLAGSTPVIGFSFQVWKVLRGAESS